MRYLGGKSRLARRIAPILDAAAPPGTPYLEPFVGGGSILCAMAGRGRERYALDANPALIAMWRELQAGWDPPDSLSEGEWRWLRALQDPADPMTAFAGFGCSFGGSWFQAYARNEQGTNIAASVARGLRKQRELVSDVLFDCRRYWDLDPKGMLVYCDPPYAGTAGYKGVDGGRFDSDRFWEAMFRWAKQNVAVFVSEFSAPDDPGIEPVWSLDRCVTMAARGSYSRRTDYLYRVHP